MRLHMDYGERIVLNTSEMVWTSSPSPAVQRKMLERDGEEVARATSLVRYLPGAAFPPHEHAAGEEIFVLSGLFSDENGDYPEGTYLRNPPGTSHRPFSRAGATIFVKLRYMDDLDQDQVVSRAVDRIWQPGLVDGLEVAALHSVDVCHTALVRWAPGTVFRTHSHPGGEEILVLEGVFADDHGSYPQGTWIRNPPWSTHRPFSDSGCTLLVKTGHLATRVDTRTAIVDPPFLS